MLKEKKFILALILLAAFSLTFVSADNDQSKKAYELMYQDIQALKIQVQDLTVLIKKNSADLQELKDQVKILGELLRKSQTDQSELKEELKSIPLQYQHLNSKLEEIELQTAILQDILQSLQNISAQIKPAEKVSAKSGKSQPVKKEQPPAEAQKPAVITIPAQEMYNNAYGDYLKGNYDLAVDGFRLFLQQYPTSPLADNALYWIGECYYSQGKYEEAIENFNDLLLSYPAGDKVPAAYLKKGMCQAQLNKKDEAVATLKLLISKYPSSEEARLAQQKINELVGK
ncbi:MAG: tol-pal system protein YbgF [Candidatus Aminicenantes bacterium]|nr:tol-pal system protein YbgF [Candidatus Aminicenantes bacterium]